MRHLLPPMPRWRSRNLSATPPNARRDANSPPISRILRIAEKGHKYLTLVYQLEAGSQRLLGVGRERKIETLEGFFDWFGEQWSGRLEVVCSDMWKAYLRVVAERAREAVHVLDRFHIVQKLGQAIDEVRAAEAKQLRAQGEQPVLKNTRWLLLRRKENLSEEQEWKLAELVKLNLRTVRA